MTAAVSPPRYSRSIDGRGFVRMSLEHSMLEIPFRIHGINAASRSAFSNLHEGGRVGWCVREKKFEYRHEHLTRRNLGEPTCSIPEAHVIEFWNREAIPGRQFRTLDGKIIVLRSAGRRNALDGPDFLDSIVEFEGRTLHGAIEVHRTTDDWRRHRHDSDGRYDAVVLHVVLRHTGSIRDSRNCTPIVALEENLLSSMRPLWLDAMRDAPARSTRLLACSDWIDAIPSAKKEAMVSLMAARRLARKCDRVRQRAEELGARSSGEYASSPDAVWDQVFYEMIAEALGYGANAGAMRRFARTNTLRILSEERVLSAPLDERSAILIRRAGVRFHSPRSLDKSRIADWNFKARPRNAPVQRFSVLARLLPSLADGSLLRAVESTLLTRKQSSDEIAVRLRTIFDCASEEGSSTTTGIGSERIDEIITNVCFPLIAVRASLLNNAQLQQNAERLFFHFPNRARNAITTAVSKTLALPCRDDAARQQGMIELYRSYCDPRLCAECLCRFD